MIYLVNTKSGLELLKIWADGDGIRRASRKRASTSASYVYEASVVEDVR